MKETRYTLSPSSTNLVWLTGAVRWGSPWSLLSLRGYVTPQLQEWSTARRTDKRLKWFRNSLVRLAHDELRYRGLIR